MRRWLCIAALLFVATGGHGLEAGDDLSDYEKGLALRSESKSRQAIEAFDRAIAADPRHVQALIQKARRWKIRAAGNRPRRPTGRPWKSNRTMPLHAATWSNSSRRGWLPVLAQR